MCTEAAPTNVGLRGEESDGQVAMIENIISASFAGPVLQLHDFDEGLYVIDGELTCQVPHETQQARYQGQPADGRFRVTLLAIPAADNWAIAGAHFSPIAERP